MKKIILFGICILLLVGSVNAFDFDEYITQRSLYDDFNDVVLDDTLWDNDSKTPYANAINGSLKLRGGQLEFNESSIAVPANAGRLVNTTTKTKAVTWDVNFTTNTWGYISMGLGNGTFVDHDGVINELWYNSLRYGYFVQITATSIGIYKDIYGNGADRLLNMSYVDTLSLDNISLMINDSGVYLFVNDTFLGYDSDTDYNEKMSAWMAVGAYGIRNTVYRVDNTYLYTYSVLLNVNFFHLINSSTAEDINISVEFISDTEYYNFSTTDGTLEITRNELPSGEYTIRYSTQEHGYNNYYYNFDYLNSTNDYEDTLNLYLTNSSASPVTVTVYNQLNLNSVEGAYVYLLRFFPNNNSFNVVSEYQTDISGKAYFNVDNDEFHKFFVDYPLGDRKLETEKFYIESSNINLYILLTADVAEEFFEEVSIISSLTFDSTINSFVGSWTDTNLVSSNFCLYIKEKGFYDSTTLNTSCSTSATGSIELSYPYENGTTYYSFLTANLDGEEVTIKTWWKDFLETDLNSGAFGLLMTVILIITFTMMGSISILTLIFADVGLLLSKMLGLITIDWGFIITIVMASLILAMVIKLKK